MVLVRILMAISAAATGLLLAAGSASAQPQIPATFYGSVTVDGQPAEAGTEVRGYIGGIDCTQSAPGERPVIRDGAVAAYVLYVVHDSQRPGCARDNATVTFTIGGRPAVQTAGWKPGPLRLDLSAGAAPPIPLPSPTGIVGAAISTAVAGTAIPSPAPSLSRPTGTPPTDDVRFDGTPLSGATPGQPAEVAEDGDSDVLVLVVVVLGALALAGGGAGVILSRRSRGGAGRGEP